MKFQEKTVVITGGNSEIGQAIATEFNKEGAKIAIFGRNADTLNTVKSSLREGIAISGGEFVKPEEIANAALFLSSPEASSIVGIDLVIDGGFTAIQKE